jgi:hypothetical protein
MTVVRLVVIVSLACLCTAVPCPQGATDGYARAGQDLLQDGKQKEALVCFRHALKKKPPPQALEKAVLHQMSSMAYLQLRELEKAESHIRDALAVKGLRSSMYSAFEMNYGQILFMRGSLQKSVGKLSESRL